MKKKLLLLCLFLISISSVYSQHYLAKTIKSVNLRESASVDADILKKLNVNKDIFVFEEETENDFYHIIDIESDTEGYVHKDYLKLIKPMSRNQGKTFTKDNDIEEYDSKIKIQNDTNRNLTLRLNSTIYTFTPYERKEIDLSPGFYTILASSPGVTPYSGGDDVISNSSYSWKFFIRTTTVRR